MAKISAGNQQLPEAAKSNDAIETRGRGLEYGVCGRIARSRGRLGFLSRLCVLRKRGLGAGLSVNFDVRRP